LGTILHEAAHKLGPSAEYKVDGKTDAQVFGGPLAAMLEELKAQTAALYYLQLLVATGVIDQDLARKTYADSIVWALGHIASGMYERDGTGKPYSHVSAIQVGLLMELGVVRWDSKAKAANGSDLGAFTIAYDKLDGAAVDLMRQVAGIKARGDRGRAEHLVKQYVDGALVPHRIIAERFARHPKVSFVYSVTR
jgi:hypothetical protein